MSGGPRLHTFQSAAMTSSRRCAKAARCWASLVWRRKKTGSRVAGRERLYCGIINVYARRFAGGQHPHGRPANLAAPLRNALARSPCHCGRASGHGPRRRLPGPQISRPPTSRAAPPRPHPCSTSSSPRLSGRYSRRSTRLVSVTWSWGWEPRSSKVRHQSRRSRLQLRFQQPHHPDSTEG